MAIVVEAGSIVTGANSYASEAELTAYALARSVTLTADEEPLLIQAMDFIESLSFIGDKKTKAQPLQWPRENVFIDNFEYEDTEIPQELKDAQMAVALSIDAGINPLGAITRAVKREKVDVIEVEYMDNAAAVDIARNIGAAIRKLIKAGSYGGVSFRVIRG